jgi:hypothetical protein
VIEAALGGVEPVSEPLQALRVGGAKLADRLGEPRRRRFAAARDPLAGALAAPDDVVEQLLGPVAGAARRFGRRREGSLDGAAQGVAHGLRAGAVALPSLFVAIAQRVKLRVPGAHRAAVISYRRAAVPFYLRPSAPTASDALICGDPARALAIAQHVLTRPRMSNHNRGLWGYYGETARGRPLTVQATGIGAPSAAAVLAESAHLGVRRVIRIGTCAAIGGSPALGSAAVVTAAGAGDGVSRTLGAAGDVLPDEALTAGLAAAADATGATVRSADLIPARDGLGPPGAAGLHDLQTAAVLELGHRLGIATAAALVVRSVDGRPLEDEPLDVALLRLAAAAAAALANTEPTVEG